MGKLLVRGFLFLMLLLVPYAVLYVYNPFDAEKIKSSDYMMAIGKKHDFLEKVSSPKIIFCGGSSVAFGVDSKAIGDSLGRVGVNLGLHAGLGLKYLVNEALDAAKPGDVLVVSTEFYLGDGSPKMLAYLSEAYPISRKWMDLSLFEKAELPYEKLTGFMYDASFRIQNTVLRGKTAVMKKDTDNIYKKRGFNGHGDYTLHLDEVYKPWGIFTRYDQPKLDYSDQINILNKLSLLQQKGIVVFYAFPAYPKEEFKRFERSLLSFESQMRTGLKFPVLGRVTDFLYPESDFYDTVYHLRRKGREERTKKMVDLLRVALEKPKTKI